MPSFTTRSSPGRRNSSVCSQQYTFFNKKKAATSCSMDAGTTILVEANHSYYGRFVKKRGWMKLRNWHLFQFFVICWGFEQNWFFVVMMKIVHTTHRDVRDIYTRIILTNEEGEEREGGLVKGRKKLQENFTIHFGSIRLGNCTFTLDVSLLIHKEWLSSK